MIEGFKEQPISPEDQIIAELTQQILLLTNLIEYYNDKEQSEHSEEEIKERVSSTVKNILKSQNGEEKLREILEKVSQNPYAVSKIQENPSLLFSLLRKGSKYIKDNGKLNYYIYYFTQREQEVRTCWNEREKRIKENPFANDEEIVAGTYKEAIESQVRDAVFTLQNKGYSSFESGFHAVGNQYIGFDKDSTRGNIEIPNILKTKMEDKGISIKVITKSKDRDQIILIPTGLVTIEEWKEIWDEVAGALHPINNLTDKKTGYGKDFLRKQQLMREGKDVELEMGYAYIGGEVKKVTPSKKSY